MTTVARSEAEMAESSPLEERTANRMDEAAFQTFYRETAAKFAGYVRRAAKDAALAADIFQEALLRFLRTCPSGLDARQKRAYLYRTGMSLLTDHWRRAKRERLWNLLWPSHEAVSDTGEMGHDMKEIFAKLKPQEQALLWLAYVEGFDHREIASALQLREGSVKVLLFRARKRLARILSEHGLGPQEPL